jgi:LacI family transcriptional regulator
VAQKAGVSKSTVSLVLRNSPTVRPETRADIQRAITELGYVYNRAAANLRSANAGLIGLVINDLRNPFFTEFATSLQMALATRGYAAVVANTGEDPALQSQVVGAMIEHGVAALIISPTYSGDDGAFAAIARAGIPAMQVLRRADRRTDLFPFAAPDYESGSRLATEHLVRSGATRIAFVGGLQGREVTEERMSGYIRLATETGTEPLVLPGRASRAFGREAANWLATDHPEVDGVICFNDLVALGLLSGCAAIGRPVGPGLRIVGFDDIEDCALTFPTLSSVRCDIARFGEHVAVMVLDWLENGTKPPVVSRTAVELVVRGSSGGLA